VTQLTGSSTQGTLTADSQPTKFFSLNGHDTFVAGSGDDTFVITNAETIVLPAKHGVETVEWWGNGSYNLPEGITNLVMKHVGTATGNSGNDRLVASDWGNTLIAGTGTDLLVGGAGNDTFVIKAGTGSDTIANLGAGDKIVISGSFADFASAKAAMTQVGSDVVLDMGSGQHLTLRGASLSALSSGQFTFSNPASTSSAGSTSTGTGGTTSTGTSGSTTTGTTGQSVSLVDLIHHLQETGAGLHIGQDGSGFAQLNDLLSHFNHWN
jgi:Ca2+-binding RTX toxin-like protein